MGQARLKKINLDANYEEIGTLKANFDEIYTQEDPRSYYTVLGALHYVIPDVALTLFSQIVHYLQSTKKRKLVILDLGCSYGVNAALLKYNLKFAQLFDRYTSENMSTLNASDVINLDTHYFKAWPKNKDIKIIGLDISQNALNYGKRTGVLDETICLNLEEEELSPDQKKLLKNVDLIISTGCIGYITSKTFQKIMSCYEKGKEPCVASFVLRIFPYAPISDVLKKHHLTSEKLKTSTFIQRRFASQAEYDETIKTLKSQRKSVRDKEAKGFFHTEFYLSRPKELIEQKPLNEIVSLTTGISKLYKRSYP